MRILLTLRASLIAMLALSGAFATAARADEGSIHFSVIKAGFIVGGSAGGVGVVAVGAVTVIRNGPTVARLTPSETAISISAVVPTSSSAGVPFNSPVHVLKVAHAGVFEISNVKVLLSASETFGT